MCARKLLLDGLGIERGRIAKRMLIEKIERAAERASIGGVGLLEIASALWRNDRALANALPTADAS